MERPRIFEPMSELRLYGMKAAYDEIMATGIKRQHEPPRIVGDLLQAEVGEKQARSIKSQIRIAKLPLAKDLDDFEFEGTPINERLVRDLAQGDLLAEQRNCVFIGGTGAGKTHLAIAIARSCHVGLGPGLVDEDQACGVDPGLVFFPLLTPSRDVGAILLAGEHGFF
jgi:DNA replication protein DnaC